jgi:hypothetical protein
MSQRRSTFFRHACSGLMWAALPRVMPLRVAAALIVGDLLMLPAAGVSSNALAKPKSRIFTMPSGLTFTLAGLEVAMDDAPLVCVFQPFDDLLGDVRRFIQL